MRKASIENNVLIGFGTAISVLMLLVELSVHYAFRFIETDKWVNHTQHVKNLLEYSVSTMFRTELEQRGYILAGTDEYLKTRDEALFVLDKIHQ